MKTHNTLATAAVVTMILAPSLAGAVTIDFASLANGHERGYTLFTHSEGSITLNASGQSADGLQNYYTYLDSGNAGIGVCKQLTASFQCTPSSDDNVTYNEQLRLDFGRSVTLSEITFVNGDHGTAFDGVFKLAVDGGPAATYNLSNLFSTTLTGQTFDFINPNIAGGSNVSNNYQFYISAVNVAAVPVPAAVWLFGSGLLGMAGISRRKHAI